MNEIITHKVKRSVWWGWGDPAEAKPLNPKAWTILEKVLGVKRLRHPVNPVQITDVILPESKLSAARLKELQEIAEVKMDRRSRIEHASGKSYPDIYRLRIGKPLSAPDAVAYPLSSAEVAKLISYCQQHEINVIPFGGGTSVVGGVTPEVASRPILTIDLRYLNNVVKIDSLSQTATLETGLRGPELEQALMAQGFTLGHYPQSHQQATLGGYLAARSSGQSSAGYGRPDERVIGLKMATPSGILELGNRAPASAAGPRLIDLAVGSEGSLGIITEATLSITAAPQVKRYAAWAFPSVTAGAAALRQLAQNLGHGWMPDVCRLSDEEETWVNLTLSGTPGALINRWLQFKKVEKPCLLLLVWEGQKMVNLKARQKAALPYLKANQGRALPAMITKAWEKGRFSGPYLRDELLGQRILADTLETATTWENLPKLHSAVRKAIRAALSESGSNCIVMGHLSHIYSAGSSLYYTFIAPEDEDPLAQWQHVKTKACQAIIANGGTISHHHAVGSDHRSFLAEEIGNLGCQVLRAVKAELDPKGIMNPGKLI